MDFDVFHFFIYPSQITSKIWSFMQYQSRCIILRWPGCRNNSIPEARVYVPERFWGPSSGIFHRLPLAKLCFFFISMAIIDYPPQVSNRSLLVGTKMLILLRSFSESKFWLICTILCSILVFSLYCMDTYSASFPLFSFIKGAAPAFDTIKWIQMIIK